MYSPEVIDRLQNWYWARASLCQIYVDMFTLRQPVSVKFMIPLFFLSRVLRMKAEGTALGIERPPRAPLDLSATLSCYEINIFNETTTVYNVGAWWPCMYLFSDCGCSTGLSPAWQLFKPPMVPRGTGSTYRDRTIGMFEPGAIPHAPACNGSANAIGERNRIRSRAIFPNSTRLE